MKELGDELAHRAIALSDAQQSRDQLRVELDTSMAKIATAESMLTTERAELQAAQRRAEELVKLHSSKFEMPIMSHIFRSSTWWRCNRSVPKH